MTDQMPPGWDNQVPPDPHGRPGNPPFGQQPPPGGHPPYGQPPPPGGYPPYGQPPPPGGYPPYGQPGQPGLPPYPQAAYGQGYGSPGPGGWNAVPAPGGVPLRPLALGDLYNGAVGLARRNPTATFGLAAIVWAVYGVAYAIAAATYGNAYATEQTRIRSGQPLTTQQAGHLFAAIVPLLFVVVVLATVLNAALTGMLSAVIGRGVLGRKTGLAEAWRAGRVGAVLGATVLLFLLGVAVLAPVVVGVVVLAALHLAPAAALLGALGGIGSIVFLILLVVRLSLTLPTVVLERVSPRNAISRSWHLTRRSFWRLFGILILTWIVVTVASGVLTIPFNLVGQVVSGGSASPFGTTSSSVAALILGAIGTILAAAVTRPIFAGVNVLLYVDLRMRREGLDLTLRNAAQNQTLAGDEFAAVWRPPAADQGTPSAW